MGLVGKYTTVIALTAISAFAIRTFVFEPYVVQSDSMHPTLEKGDFILVQKWPYGFWLPFSELPISEGRVPERGEIVIYAQPEDPKLESLKRVIEIRVGANIELKDRKVLVDGKSTAADQSTADCAPENTTMGAFMACWQRPFIHYGPTKVPPGHLFALADYRAEPLGDRQLPPAAMVPLRNMKARVAIIWLSIAPPTPGSSTPWYKRIRWERIFRTFI